jgi:hypothetical protein
LRVRFQVLFLMEINDEGCMHEQHNAKPCQ